MSIEINNISKLYGKQKALDSVNFTVGEGELVGFLGPNGAGKSTLMKIITGYLQASAGEVYVNDSLVSIKNKEIRKKIGYLPEHNPLYTDLYVKEYLEITAGMYQLPEKKKKVIEMIDLTGLGDEQHKKIRALSKGYRQRVGLAQALIHDPSVLILDEPTTGLDPNQLEEIRSLIKEISKEKTVMLSTHIMQEVEAICSRVLIINKGKIAADGSVNELKGGNFNQFQQIVVEFEQKVEQKQLLSIEGIDSVKPNGSAWLITAKGDSDIRPDIFKFAVDNSLVIFTLQEKTE